MISAVALLGTLGNTWIVFWRGRKRVRIRTSEVEESGSGTGPFIYQCQVTNDGFIGVQIDSVEIYPAKGGNVGIPLRLPLDEKPKKLDQGESQAWGKYLHELEEELVGEGRLDVVAVARDTTGKEYKQKRGDSLPIQLPSQTS